MAFVTYSGSSVNTTQTVLDRLGLREGQVVDQDQFQAVVAENLAETIHQLAYEKPGDYSDNLAAVELVRMRDVQYLDRLSDDKDTDIRVLEKVSALLGSNSG